MTTFQGIRKELDFALRYNWRGLKSACLEVLRHKTGDLGGLSSSMRDTEIMGLLDTLVIAERRKSGLVDKEEDNMSGDGLEGIRWTTPSGDDIKEEIDGRDEMDDDDEDDEDDQDDDGDESNEVADETTMDLVLLE